MFLMNFFFYCVAENLLTIVYKVDQQGSNNKGASLTKGHFERVNRYAVSHATTTLIQCPIVA